MNQFLTEIHLHTKESSSCSKVSAQEMIDLYYQQNYSTIITTDHCSPNKMKRLGEISWKEKVDFIYHGHDIAKEYGNSLGINVLLGVEMTLQSTDSDYLIYGIDRQFLYKHENMYTYTLEKLHQICQQNGYILVQAHPFRDDIQLAPLEYIDGIEVYNGCHDEHSRNKKAFQYGNGTNKILTSGSDFHHPKDLARGGIITQKEIKNIQQFVQILKSGEYTIKTT